MQGKYFLIFLLYAFVRSTWCCELSIIKKQVAKFHGPQWSEVSDICKKNQIKSQLKKIIAEPQNYLSEYDNENQKFIYRNAVKSYGHFGTSNSDLIFLSTIYNDKNNNLKNMFGDDANLFRITILESMANTGNLDSINFFQKIMENDNNVLFLQQYAIDFAGWIINGSPLIQNDSMQGSKVYAEVFFPNLYDTAENRFKNNQNLLEKLLDKKNILKNILSDMLARPEKFQEIKSSILNLNQILNNTLSTLQVDTTSINNIPSNIDDHDMDNKNSYSKNNSSNTSNGGDDTQNRHPASETEKNSQTLPVIILLTLCLMGLFLLSRKTK